MDKKTAPVPTGAGNATVESPASIADARVNVKGRCPYCAVVLSVEATREELTCPECGATLRPEENRGKQFVAVQVELLDYIGRAGLTLREIIVVHTYMRCAWGRRPDPLASQLNRRNDWIALRELVSHTHLHKTHVYAAVRTLNRRNLIIKANRDGDTFIRLAPIRVWRDTALRKPVTKSVTETGGPVTESVTETGEAVTKSVTETGGPVTKSVTETGEVVTESVTRSGEPVTESVTESDRIGHSEWPNRSLQNGQDADVDCVSGSPLEYLHSNTQRNTPLRGGDTTRPPTRLPAETPPPPRNPEPGCIQGKNLIRARGAEPPSLTEERQDSLQRKTVRANPITQLAREYSVKAHVSLKDALAAVKAASRDGKFSTVQRVVREMESLKIPPAEPVSWLVAMTERKFRAMTRAARDEIAASEVQHAGLRKQIVAFAGKHLVPVDTIVDIIKPLLESTDADSLALAIQKAASVSGSDPFDVLRKALRESTPKNTAPRGGQWV